MSLWTAEEQIDRLTPREVVFLNDILRIEEDLHRYRSLSNEVEREAYQLLLDQLQLVMDRLSPEDDFLWQHVGRIAEWLRAEALARMSSGEYSLAELVARAESNKGAPLTSEEYDRLSDLSKELAEVDRMLTE